MKLIQILTDIVCSTLLAPEALNRACRRRGAFTRNCGKLPYWTVMKLRLRMNRMALQTMPSACNGRKVRVLKFYLPGGDLETLITNETGLDGSMFRRLYFLRWPVEENYKLIKEKIGLTDFRGCSENSVMQEFRISMLLANLSLAVKKEVDGIIDCSINQKGNKHRYMTNKNELVGCLCRRLPEYMDACTLDEKFTVIRDLFKFAIHALPNYIINSYTVRSLS